MNTQFRQLGCDTLILINMNKQLIIHFVNKQIKLTLANAFNRIFLWSDLIKIHKNITNKRRLLFILIYTCATPKI